MASKKVITWANFWSLVASEWILQKLNYSMIYLKLSDTFQ